MDRDLAELRGAKTKVLKQAVRRNIDRFPGDFIFEPTDSAFKNWRSPFVISCRDQMGSRYGPMVVTIEDYPAASCGECARYCGSTH